MGETEVIEPLHMPKANGNFQPIKANSKEISLNPKHTKNYIMNVCEFS